MRALYLTISLVVAAAWAEPGFAAELSLGYEAFTDGDYDSAWDELLPLAGQGNHIAAYYVGIMYLEGRGTAKDVEKAVGWLTRAAERGHVAAQLQLAQIYEAGTLGEEDFRLAAKWMQAAAEGGDADAQYYLGRYYAEGIGVVTNPALAYEWIHRSVEYGDSNARFLDALLYLGSAFEWGRGLRQDLVESYKWFALAESYSVNEENIHVEASRALGALALRLSAADRTEAEDRAVAWRESR